MYKDASMVYNAAKVVRVPVLRVPIISASRTLGTGGTQSLQHPRYPEDWRDSVLFGPFRAPDTLGTGDWRDSVLSAKAPDTLGTGDWRDSVLSAPKVPLGLAGLGPSRPRSTLETVLQKDWCWRVIESRGLVGVL